MRLKDVEVFALIEDPFFHSPVLILFNRESQRILPIVIGHFEARAIALSLQGIITDRPLTHDLLLKSIQECGGKVSRIVVEKIENNTFFSSLHIIQGENKTKIDARPSDAIALALRARAPIFVNENLLLESGQPNPFNEPSPQSGEKKFTDEELEKIREMLKKAQEREERSSN